MGVPPHGSSPPTIWRVAATQQEVAEVTTARANERALAGAGVPAFAKAPARSRRSAMNDKRAQAEDPRAK